MSDLKPSEIVKELDKYIIGQNKAKRSVAVALRNRWRRQYHRKRVRHIERAQSDALAQPSVGTQTEIVGAMFYDLYLIPYKDLQIPLQPLSGTTLSIKHGRRTDQQTSPFFRPMFVQG